MALRTTVAHKPNTEDEGDNAPLIEFPWGDDHRNELSQPVLKGDPRHFTYNGEHVAGYFGEGDDYFYGFSLYVPFGGSFPDPAPGEASERPSWHTLFQFHSVGRCDAGGPNLQLGIFRTDDCDSGPCVAQTGDSYQFALVKRDTYTTDTTRVPTRAAGQDGNYRLWPWFEPTSGNTVPLERGRWHTFVLHVKWSTNPNLGVVELWHDGKPVYPDLAAGDPPTRATLYSWPSTSICPSGKSEDPGWLPSGPMPVYMKTGLYRDRFTGHTETIFHADLRIGTTYEDVAPEENVGQVVTGGSQMPNDDPAVVSPLTVGEPVYGCGGDVHVYGTLPNAKVTLSRYTNTTGWVDVGSAEAGKGGWASISVAVLDPGDLLRARQQVGGVVSGESPSIVVRDRDAYYPNGLRPRMGEPNYECGLAAMAWNLIPGSTATFFSSTRGQIAEGLNRLSATVAVRTPAHPDSDGLSVQQTYVCGGTSNISHEAKTFPGPATLPTPIVEPYYASSQIVTVRNLLPGAEVRVTDGSTVLATVVAASDSARIRLHANAPATVTASQRLCGSLLSPAGYRAVASCSAMPAPRIRRPRDGDLQVFVYEAVEGARIRVFAGQTEIGDGMGAVVGLTRPFVEGETVYVVQEVGTCRSELMFQISVGASTSG